MQIDTEKVKIFDTLCLWCNYEGRLTLKMLFQNKRSAANCNLILEKGHFRGQGQIRISQMNLFDPSLGPEQLLDQIAWHAVEKQAHHDQQQQSQDDLDDEPFVAVAYQVADGLQRA